MTIKENLKETAHVYDEQRTIKEQLISNLNECRRKLASEIEKTKILVLNCEEELEVFEKEHREIIIKIYNFFKIDLQKLLQEKDEGVVR